MFDIGFLELALVGVIGLLVLGPERLPRAIQTGSLWLGKLRKNFNSIKNEIDLELNSDELKRELQNQSVLENLESASTEINREIEDLQQQLSTSPYDSSDVINPNTTSPIANDDKQKNEL
tara:strand:+ start:1024 stop:1383 length:360 start_codon:yes stop_codon:yes gene_type:complete